MKRQLDSAMRENQSLSDKQREMEEKLKELSNKAALYDQAKEQLDEKLAESEELKKKQKDLEDEVKSLRDELAGQDEKRKREMDEKFAELNEELADKRKRIRQLTEQVDALKTQLEDLKKTELDERVTMNAAKMYNGELKNQLKARTDELEAARQQLKRLQGEHDDLLKRYSQVEAEMKRQKEESDTKISACEKARQEAQLLAEKRGWAVGPLSLALSLTAKEVDPVNLSWDAREAVEDATKAAWEEKFLGLPENIVSLELPKGLDPRYVLAFWTGLFDYASARFVADAVAMAWKELDATPAGAITADKIKEFTKMVDAKKERADEFLSTASVELFDSYSSVKRLLGFLSSDEINHEALSLVGYADGVKREVAKRMEDLSKLVAYAALGKIEARKSGVI
ncbi:hypothetical protein [Tardisphaera saccharovorans]